VTALTKAEMAALYADDELGAVARSASKAGPQSQAWFTVCRLMDERAATAALVLLTQTCDTAPFHIWRASVVEHARVSDEDTRRFATELLSTSYQTGTAARDVVPELTRTVRRGLINERVERERRAARHTLRVARHVSLSTRR
jgi:hypothetical protein